MKKATSPDSSDVIIAEGSVSYTAPDGTLITLTYKADDENGFQPQVNTVLFLSFGRQTFFSTENLLI